MFFEVNKETFANGPTSELLNECLAAKIDSLLPRGYSDSQVPSPKLSLACLPGCLSTTREALVPLLKSTPW